MKKFVFALAAGLCVLTQARVAFGEPPAAGSPSRSDYFVVDPIWAEGGQDFSRFYPDRAQRLGVEGDALTLCKARDDGSLSECLKEGEGPAGFGFGDAALLMARARKAQARSASGRAVFGHFVLFRTHFSLPFGAKNPAPGWTQQPSAEQIAAAYPAGRRKNALTWSICIVKADLSLGDCHVDLIWPIDPALQAAPLKLFSLYRASASLPVSVFIAWEAKSGSRPAKESASSAPAMASGPAQIPIATLAAKNMARDFHWRAMATPDQIESVRPVGENESAYVQLRCQVKNSRQLEDCVVGQELPAGRGFGQAALNLAADYSYVRTADLKIEWPARP